MKGLKRLITVLLILILIMPVFMIATLILGLNKMHDSAIDTEALRVTSYSPVEGIKNILLVGTDERPGEKSSRSDSMMILTIDTVHDSLKLTSLARDAYVNVPGHGRTKLTHAFYYGGANLLIQTIENNFNVDINDYVRVNFDSFMYIIDALGGVDINVKQSEIAETNKFINETYKWYQGRKGDIEYIEHAGEQRLNGYQALSFARIRKNDSGFERDRRQRDLMQSIMKGIKNASKFRYLLLARAVMPYVKTNMRPLQMLRYAFQVTSFASNGVKQMEFPIPDGVHGIGGIYGGAGWVLRYTPQSVNILQDFIYRDIQYNR